jgi:hypothetical protein
MHDTVYTEIREGCLGLFMNCDLQGGSASGQFSTALNQKALLTQLAT